MGADIPSPWLLLTIFIPIIGVFICIYWIVKWYIGAGDFAQTFNGTQLLLLTWVAPFVVQVIIAVAYYSTQGEAPGYFSPISLLQTLIGFVTIGGYMYIQTKFNLIGGGDQQSAVPPYQPPQPPQQSANPQDFQNPQPPQHN